MNLHTNLKKHKEGKIASDKKASLLAEDRAQTGGVGCARRGGANWEEKRGGFRNRLCPHPVVRQLAHATGEARIVLDGKEGKTEVNGLILNVEGALKKRKRRKSSKKTNNFKETEDELKVKKKMAQKPNVAAQKRHITCFFYKTTNAFFLYL